MVLFHEQAVFMIFNEIKIGKRYHVDTYKYIAAILLGESAQIYSRDSHLESFRGGVSGALEKTV